MIIVVQKREIRVKISLSGESSSPIGVVGSLEPRQKRAL
jgi:hypothetical protein